MKNWLIKWGGVCYFPISMALDLFLAKNANASVDVCCGVQSQILAEPYSSAALFSGNKGEMS